METEAHTAAFVRPEASNPNDTTVRIDSSTLVNVGSSTEPALDVLVPGSITAGDARIDVTNSIIRGFDFTWNMSVPIGPGFPGATLNIDHSNFAPTSAEGSAGTANVEDPSNINLDPYFVSPQDFRLLPDSPSIDAGDPASTLISDIEGALRPVDGNLDGSALPDQGAYEFQPTCATNPSICPDTTKPRVSKVKFRFKRGKGGAIRMRLSEKSRVRVVLAPTPKGKGKKKRKKVVIVRRQARAGALTLKLGKKKLSPGRYRLVIVATDKSGNKSKPVIRKVRAR